jgi:Major Facilitator Superfamily
LWTLFCPSVGAAQVPYADVFARVIPAGQRSRLLGGRGLAGGLLGVGAGLAVRYHLDLTGAEVGAYAIIFLAGAVAFGLSAVAFALIHEPPTPGRTEAIALRALLAENVRTLRGDRRFRLFLVSQMLDAVALSALPFYVVQVARTGALPDADVGLLLAAHTVGAVGVNPLWGWWGDHRGKLALLRTAAPIALVTPLAAIALAALPGLALEVTRPAYLAIFFLNGASASGRIVGDLGYLMEISPDDRRAEYSGYLNTWLAPIRLLPLLVALAERWLSLAGIFALAAGAAALRMAYLSRLDQLERTPAMRRHADDPLGTS